MTLIELIASALITVSGIRTLMSEYRTRSPFAATVLDAVHLPNSLVLSDAHVLPLTRHIRTSTSSLHARSPPPDANQLAPLALALPRKDTY